jgi:hypothetical protein
MVRENVRSGHLGQSSRRGGLTGDWRYPEPGGRSGKWLPRNPICSDIADVPGERRTPGSKLVHSTRPSAISADLGQASLARRSQQRRRPSPGLDGWGRSPSPRHGRIRIPRRTRGPTRGRQRMVCRCYSALARRRPDGSIRQRVSSIRRRNHGAGCGHPHGLLQRPGDHGTSDRGELRPGTLCGSW